MTRRLTSVPIAAILAVGVGAGIVLAAPPAAAAAPPCLWAGTVHAQGTTVTAGGSTYACGTDAGGAAWRPSGPASGPSTVPNPGSTTNPTGLFSPGARQPGTAYNDYCVGAQLVPGTEDIYQAVPGGDGNLYWKAAAPISQWRFDPGAAHPDPTTRTASLCRDGNLM